VFHHGGPIFVLGILFLAVVAPVWIGFHYLTRWRTARSLSREDERTLVDLWEAARRMEARIENLERAVGAEAPAQAPPADMPPGRQPGSQP
jgi:phage shock protein B